MLASEVMLARLAAGAAEAGGAGGAAAGGAGAAAAAAARIALHAPEVTEETKEPETEGTEAGTEAELSATDLALLNLSLLTELSATDEAATDEAAREEGGETTPAWLQHAAVAVACTSPDTLRPTSPWMSPALRHMDAEPASLDTWTSPALGRMVTDVQSRLEAAVSPDELSPDELLATPPDELTAA